MARNRSKRAKRAAYRTFMRTRAAMSCSVFAYGLWATGFYRVHLRATTLPLLYPALQRFSASLVVEESRRFPQLRFQ